MKQVLLQAVAYAKGEADTGRYRVHVPEQIDVRAIRKKLGMTQEEFAARFGFSVNTLRHWEHGKRQPEGPDSHLPAGHRTGAGRRGEGVTRGVNDDGIWPHKNHSRRSQSGWGVGASLLAKRAVEFASKLSRSHGGVGMGCRSQLAGGSGLAKGVHNMVERAHAKDLRRGRVSEIGRAYVLTSVCAGRDCVFTDWRLGRLVAQEFRAAQELGIADSLAWVVMPDHFHWLCILRQGSLARLMQRVKSCSAVAVNRTTLRSSALWQAGYHDHALREEEDVKDVANYILANPIRAGLTRRIGDYPLWDAVWL